jgi:hypothetical protein
MLRDIAGSRSRYETCPCRIGAIGRDSRYYDYLDTGERTMTPEETRAALIQKFERDVAKRSRWYRFLLVLDQMGNVLFWNGSQDETISSHIGRRIEAGSANWFEKKLCCVLKKIEGNHCQKAKGE